jgi:single-strand DNA-binding protein
MLELNRVFLAGNLTQDPDTRYLPSGMAVSKLRIAANRRFQDSKTGERREEVLYINVEAWGKSAELCQQYLQKGRRILVEGNLRMNAYQAKDGTNRSEILIRADRVHFLDSRASSDSGAPAEGGFGHSDPGHGDPASPSPRPLASSPPQASHASRPPYPPSAAPEPRKAAGESFPPRGPQNPQRQYDNAYEPDPVAPTQDNGDSAPEFDDNSGGTNNDLPF